MPDPRRSPHSTSTSLTHKEARNLIPPWHIPTFLYRRAPSPDLKAPPPEDPSSTKPTNLPTNTPSQAVTSSAPCSSDDVRCGNVCIDPTTQRCCPEGKNHCALSKICKTKPVGHGEKDYFCESGGSLSSTSGGVTITISSTSTTTIGGESTSTNDEVWYVGETTGAGAISKQADHTQSAGGAGKGMGPTTIVRLWQPSTNAGVRLNIPRIFRTLLFLPVAMASSTSQVSAAVASIIPTPPPQVFNTSIPMPTIPPDPIYCKQHLTNCGVTLCYDTSEEFCCPFSHNVCKNGELCAAKFSGPMTIFGCAPPGVSDGTDSRIRTVTQTSQNENKTMTTGTSTMTSTTSVDASTTASHTEQTSEPTENAATGFSAPVIFAKILFVARSAHALVFKSPSKVDCCGVLAVIQVLLCITLLRLLVLTLDLRAFHLTLLTAATSTMSDIEQKIRDGTLDDDASMAELWQRYNFFVNDAEAPARVKAQGLAIFRAALFTDAPAASQVSERAVVLLKRTLEAIGGLYLAEERRKTSSVAVDQTGSAVDPVQPQTRIRSSSPAAALSRSTDIIVLTRDDDNNHSDEGIERRERRRMRDRARRATDKSARHSVLHGLDGNATHSTISTEVAQSIEHTSASLHATLVAKADDMGSTAVPPDIKPRQKRKYQRRFAPKTEEFVTSDVDDVNEDEDGDNDVEMHDASILHDRHSWKAMRPLGKKSSEGEYEFTADEDLEPEEPFLRRKRRIQKTRKSARKPAMKSAEYTPAPVSARASIVHIQKQQILQRHARITPPPRTLMRRLHAQKHTHLSNATWPVPSKPSRQPRQQGPGAQYPIPPTLHHHLRLYSAHANPSAQTNTRNTAHLHTPAAKHLLHRHHLHHRRLITHHTPSPSFPLQVHSNSHPSPPILPPLKRHAFSLGATIALSNILEDHRLNPTDSLSELVVELEDNRPTVEDWERKTRLRGAEWVYWACRMGWGLRGEGDDGSDRKGGGGGKDGGEGGKKDDKDVRGEDIVILVKALEAYFETECDQLGWAREGKDEGGSDGSSDIWARE
ncbi:hypothetical protein BKA63DRAFT_556467 [Paraphoma chrysanthemicola]|nr:hypothetical protein BKA63DRAFT_556467 [Paraphoma chrysanthemicola]